MPITSEDLRAQAAALRATRARAAEPEVIALGTIRRGPVHGVSADWVRPAAGGPYLRLVDQRLRPDGTQVDRELRFWISHLGGLAHAVAEALALAEGETDR